MKGIPESHHDLLKDETKAYAFLATTMADGTPQVTPVWFNHDEDHILINSADGRVKDENLTARPQAAVLIMGLGNPYRWIQVRGEVSEITTEGAEDHIHNLSKKYTGNPRYRIPEGMTRKTYKIRPDKVSVSG